MRYFTFTNPLIYFFCFVSCFLTLNAQIYVDIDAIGTNDGSSWANAYTDLQDALVSANPGDDIWVAEGIYKPSAYPQGCSGCSSPYDYTFFVKDGVSLYGNFNGTETSLDERGDTTESTVLDGNIVESEPMINVNHVVVLYANGSNTRIDGFIITGGNAGGNGSSIISVFGESVSPVNGGGVYAIGQFGGSPSSKVIIAGNDITLNQAGNNGGGVYIDNVPTDLLGNGIINNLANNNGGGVYSSIEDSNSTIFNNSIFENRATNDGGGLHVSGTTTYLIEDNNIGRNEADFGAGIFMNGNCFLSKNSIFTNRAFNSGGGILGLNSAYTLVNNQVFSNIAFDVGGGIELSNSSGEIINNTIASNFSAECIGDLNGDNCISDAFEAYQLGSGGGPEVVFSSGGTSLFINNIVWGFGEGVTPAPGVTASNSIIKGGFSGLGILDEDPMFIFQPKITFTSVDDFPNSDINEIFGSGDLRLQSASPAIDWGDTSSYDLIIGDSTLDTDIQGRARLFGPSIDSGAFEQQGNKFILAPNGVTCLCPDAEIGESGTLVIGGVEKTFTKISEEDLILAGSFDFFEVDENLGLFCTSGITNMFALFSSNITFNQDISSWDVSSVTYMGGMFNGATLFDQDISSWDVSNVTDMDDMFNNAFAFNQDISNWCVEQITSEPNNFSTNSPLPNNFKPNWGATIPTCSFFVWDGNSWSPNDPITGPIVSTPSNRVEIKGGTAKVNGRLIAKDVIIQSEAVLDLKVTATLSLETEIRNNGIIVFGSNANGSAQLDEFTGTITGSGEVTVERYIPAKRAFRLLSSPVTTTDFIFENWQENGSTPATPDGLGTHITGGAASLGFDQNDSGAPSMFTFDSANQSWEALQNTNATKLIAGEAYLTMVRGDRTIDLTDNDYPANPTTLRATGALLTGSTSPKLDQQRGNYNLIANPYQAVVDYSSVIRSDLTDYIYVWDASIAGDNGRGGYVTVDVSGSTTPPNPFSSDASKFIPPGLSFFVQNLSSGPISPDIDFNESDKATGAGQVTVFSSFPDFYINSRLYLASDLQDGNSERDAIGLRFSDNFTTLGSDEDATKFINPDENFAVVNNGLRSIDKQAVPIIGHEIDLSITNYTATDYSLIFVMENKPEDIGVFLIDTYLDREAELTQSLVYHFSVDSNIPESIAEDRFELRFETGTFGTDQFELQGISVYPNPADDVLNINLRENTGRFDTVELFDINGRLVAKQALSNQLGETQLNVNSFSSGVYLLKISSESEELSTKIIIK